MVLTIEAVRPPRAIPVDEPTVRIEHSVVMNGRPGDGGRWSAPISHIQLEGEPQWNTLGAGLGAPAGPGTDDTYLWQLEPVPAQAGINEMSDGWHMSGSFNTDVSPPRFAMAVTEEQQIFAGVPEFTARRWFTLANTTDFEGGVTLQLNYHFGNVHSQSTQEYAVVDLEPVAAEAIALALVDDTARDSVLLAFWQTRDTGEVYCRAITAAQESRDNMSWPKEGNASNRYPEERSCLDLGAPTFVASGGLAAWTDGWTDAGFGGDIYFSSLQAVALGNNRVLLLRLTDNHPTFNAGDVYAHIVTYTNGTLNISAPTFIRGSIRNLYQAVADIDGTRTDVAVTLRSSTKGEVLTLDCSGTPAVTNSIEIEEDYSHVAWVADRLAVLAKSSYEIGAPSNFDPTTAAEVNAMFAGSPVNIYLYDPATLTHVGTIDADTQLLSLIQQTGTVHGFADGRLFMHCGSFDEADQIVGHTADPIGSGIRLWVVSGNSATLQDQIGMPDTTPSSTHAYRWGESVLVAGPSDWQFGAPPGSEHANAQWYFCGGVLKEGNSDVQPYRLSDNWMFVTEPEKNGVWYTSPNVSTGTWRQVESYYVRAIHVDNGGVPDIAGEPVWLYALTNFYSAACRISDTRFFHLGQGYTNVDEAIAGAAEDSVYFQVLELDESTGNLDMIYEEKNSTHELAVAIGAQIDELEIGALSTIFHAVQIGTTNRYLLLYSIRAVLEGFNTHDLWILSFELNSDFSATILDKQLVNTRADFPGFGERKAYEICPLSDDTFVVTWVIDSGDGGHFSAHRGVVVNSSAQITMGNILSADPESLADGDYGFQGTWMHNGCGVDGRYVYPCGDIWPGQDRYPPVPAPINPSFLVPQQLPYALCVMSIDPTTANLTPAWYPLKVNRDDIDEDWYDANQFFSPEPRAAHVYIPSDWRQYQAQPDGSVFYFWDITQCHRGRRRNEVWIFQGPQPTPWMISGLNDAMTMALWVLDDDTETAWYGGSWGHFGSPYHVSYMNGSVELSRGIIACVSTLDYYSRAAPQGYSAGFGSNLLRVWLAGRARGAAALGPQDVRVSSEGKDFR